MARSTAVKLDGTVFEVDPSAKKGSDTRVLSDDELFDVAVLDGHLEHMCSGDLNRVCNEVYSGVLDSLARGLRGTVLKTLGFEPTFGEWRVDHCNGRLSAISEFISDKAKTALYEGVDTIIQEDFQSILEEIRPAVRKDFKDQFRREIERGAREAATNAARGFLSQLMAEEVKKMEPALALRAKAMLLGRPLPKYEPPDEG